MDDRLTALISGVSATAAMLATRYLTRIAAGSQVLVYRLFGGIVTLPETSGYATSIAFGVLVWPMALLYVGENLAPEYDNDAGSRLGIDPVDRSLRSTVSGV